MNKDIPGFIGSIGTLIGEAKLNISNMELGRNKKNEALSFIQIDEEIPDTLLDKISKNVSALKKIYRIKI
ncbi:MAG TPA: ACT domain-containing protein [Spirochaetota bacterium]|nr:ACT domain-containing protein [Spirochaetota bacterium]